MEVIEEPGGGGSGAARHWIDSSAYSGTGRKRNIIFRWHWRWTEVILEVQFMIQDLVQIKAGAGGYGRADYSNGHGCSGGAGNPGGTAKIEDSATRIQGKKWYWRLVNNL